MVCIRWGFYNDSIHGRQDHLWLKQNIYLRFLLEFKLFFFLLVDVVVVAIVIVAGVTTATRNSQKFQRMLTSECHTEYENTIWSSRERDVRRTIGIELQKYEISGNIETQRKKKKNSEKQIKKLRFSFALQK